MKMVPTNIPGLVKDPLTGHVINTDLGEYHAIKAQRKKQKENQALVADVQQLKSDMNEIKDLLRKLLG